MSLYHKGLWHYEFIEGREIGRQWRVGDHDDDVVTDFATENEAMTCAREHNAHYLAEHKEKWTK